MNHDIVDRLPAMAEGHGHGSAWDAAARAAAAEIERLRAVLARIAGPHTPWLGCNPEYGDGYDAGRDAMADIAREALEEGLSD